jgi:hypothetical protein
MKEIGRDELFSYSNRKHLRYSKRIEISRKIKNKRFKYELNIIDDELCYYSNKTMNLETYKEYCRKKLSIIENEEVMNKYRDIYFRKMKYDLYINKKRRVSKLINELLKKYGKDVIMILGNGSVNPTMKHKISTPNITLARELNKHFEMYLIDEFRTSIIHHKTGERMKNLVVKQMKNTKRITNKRSNKVRKSKKTNKIGKIHSVLTFKMENGCRGCINRDRNAVNNMEKIYKHYIRYISQEEETIRPEVFMRETII